MVEIRVKWVIVLLLFLSEFRVSTIFANQKNVTKKNIQNYIPVKQRITNYSANKGIDTF